LSDHPAQSVRFSAFCQLSHNQTTRTSPTTSRRRYYLTHSPCSRQSPSESSESLETSSLITTSAPPTDGASSPPLTVGSRPASSSADDGASDVPRETIEGDRNRPPTDPQTAESTLRHSVTPLEEFHTGVFQPLCHRSLSSLIAEPGLNVDLNAIWSDDLPPRTSAFFHATLEVHDKDNASDGDNVDPPGNTFLSLSQTLNLTTARDR
jgi:hypothetical protein